MHLHFEKSNNTKCDCSILSLSWMGKVPDDIPESGKNIVDRFNAAASTSQFTYIKPEDLTIGAKYKVISWKHGDTKIGNRLQLEIEDKGILVMPDRFGKIFTKEEVENTKSLPKMKIKFMGRDDGNAPMYVFSEFN